MLYFLLESSRRLSWVADRELEYPPISYEFIIIDELIKSRHSRLSGIAVLYNILIRDDSGQAGMTSKESYPTFYESIIIGS